MVASRAESIERRAGNVQGIVLLCVAIFPIMGVTLIAPILPRMQEHFAAVPGVDVLIPIALTIPALCIALFSPVVGYFADRIGRRKLLAYATVLYAIFGIVPIFLDSLGLIVLSRVGVGVTEAALMTCSTTLIGDYFAGRERVKWLAFQTAVASISATLLFVIGGALGEHSWRTPFAVYATSLLVFVAVLRFTWEPVTQAAVEIATAFPFKRFAGIGGFTVFSAMIFYVVPIQFGFVLKGLSITSPATVGLATAIASLAVVFGTLTFRRINRAPVPLLLFVALLLSGLGLIGIAHATDLPLAIASAVVNQFGCGLVLPTLLTWALDGLPFALRGRGTGVWMACFFIGQFLSPLAIIALAHGDGLLGAIQIFAIACIVVSLGAGAYGARPARAGVATERLS